MATTIIGAILSPILGWIPTYIINPIATKCQVWRNLSENIEELENTRMKLEARRSDKASEVEKEMNQEGVVKSAEADLWFGQVDDALSNANNLRIEYQQSQISGTSCPNCFCRSRYQLSKRALKLKQDVHDKLFGEEPRSGWTVAPPRQIGRSMNTVCIEGQTTTEKLKGEIIDSVLDDRYVAVGLFGMGGIGKTTLLRHANEHFRMTQHFESVIFTTVSSTPNFVEIRKQIAEGFGLRNRQDDDDLKEQLSRLFQTRKYLLILDDMWEPVINLGEICNIPEPKKENGCKILLASRSKEVVTRFVIRFGARDSLRSIRVNKLQPDEAWNLFVQKVGEDITLKSSIVFLAKDVLKKCDGLPLAIVVIGSTMSTRETEGEWKDALRELEQSASNLEGMKEEVFSILMFSFEKLKPIEQSLFLFCCLFPEDHNIDKYDLFEFAIGEETLSGMHRLQDIRNKVDVLVAKLQNSSMLEDSDYFDAFKMHDMMRELAVWITSTSNNKYPSKFITKAGVGITEAPADASEWCKATKISLMMNSSIESLPQLPDQCPQVHTLLLQQTCINVIPQVHFSEHMPALQILDLSFCIELKSLPASISHLVNLRLLNLSGCFNLQDLPHGIGKLVQLISLDLGHCENLRKLPIEMKKLNNLRRLHIGSTKILKRIPRGVLSGLRKLEELDTTGSGLKWFASGVEELSQLISLSDISVEIRKANVFHWFKPFLKSKRMHSLDLRNCTIDPSIFPYLLDIDRVVQFKSCEGLTHIPTHGCQCLIVEACPDLEILLNVQEAEGNAFESLRGLRLDQLDQLQAICTGVPQPGCFSNMTSVEIQECPNLKVIFTNGVTRLLKKLRYLSVCRCPQLVKIVADEDLEINAFPSLEEMRLCELPELIDICHLDLNWPSLSEAFIYLCSKLRRPPFGAKHADILLNDEMDSQMIKSYLWVKKWKEEEEKEEKKKEEEDDDDHEDEEKEKEEEVF
ncbi:disease resistance protein RPS5-like [Macadamia integrifolia]|uniref:disease resistance protein RPS5-like n=1 Tax=Macadamia integrifolia TaxID=60698 RepID=UPI001C4F2A60|nr:disease resistance protein RPS5-like [Macadamia integrifolia]XP_042517914.1 disease resistance protein RPS5-like [Macadamia integrifolia]XP_042517923.1 disease resistance protein RPS5-like [Macadamia integrifolia]